MRSELRQWPVQLYLIPPDAPFLQGAKLTLIADCVPFAEPNTHAKYIKDSAIAVGCPKLDDGRTYIQKLAQMLIQSDIQSIRVVRMTVPCCGGLEMIARQAMSAERGAGPVGNRRRQRALNEKRPCSNPRPK